MSKSKKVSKVSKKSVARPEHVYKPATKRVPAEWGSRSAAVASLGKGGATISAVAKKMKIEQGTAKNLIRWLSWNGYVKREAPRATRH